MSTEATLRAFARFHNENPDFYNEVIRIARLAAAQGKTRLSMRGVFEFIRFDRSLRIRGDETYELNNSFTPMYARMVRDQFPELGKLFEIRESGASVQSEESERMMIQNADYYDDLLSMYG